MAADKRNRKQRKELARQLQSANPGLEVVHPRAAGIDVGNGSHYVAVRPDQDPESVRRFECFTVDLHRLADWLEACGVETIAMQSEFLRVNLYVAPAGSETSGVKRDTTYRRTHHWIHSLAARSGYSDQFPHFRLSGYYRGRIDHTRRRRGRDPARQGG